KRSMMITLDAAPSGGALQIDAPSTGLVFRLPPGRTLRLQYSSQPGAALEQMALWNLLDAATRAAIESDVTRGLHVMFTPGRDLVLVHASQRPVAPPRLDGFVTRREAGDTTLRFGDADPTQGALVSDSASTSKVEVRASWTDWVDDGIDPIGVRK